MDDPDIQETEEILPPEGEESADREEQVLPVIEEELVPGSRLVKSGGVRVSKRVERVRKTFRMPALRDVVKVSRIPVNRLIDSMPGIREEGDIVVVPVVEEEIIVQKRLVLKEEIHIHRSRTRSEVSKSVVVNKERAVVERLDSEGRVIPPRRTGLRTPKSLLDQS